MNATLTLDIDAGVLSAAEQQARVQKTTVPAILSLHLRILAQNWEDSRSGKTPITDSLRGVVKLPPGFDDKEILTEELLKKHGLQG